MKDNMGRLIDAEDAKKALIGWETEPTDEEIEYTIDRIPAVDAVPVVHGEWKYNGAVCVDAWCSICGHAIPVWMMGANFCPNCGSDMRKDKHGKEKKTRTANEP